MVKKEEDFKPDVRGMEFYLVSFKELSTCRLGATSPIPFKDIWEYWNIFPEVGDFEEFLFFIRLMDDTLLNLESNKSDSKGK